MEEDADAAFLEVGEVVSVSNQGADFVRYEKVVKDEGKNVGTSRAESVFYHMDQAKCEKK